MSKVLERDLRNEIDELKSSEEEIRKLRQEKESKLREIIERRALRIKRVGAVVP